VGFPQDDPRGESVYHLFVAYVDERDNVRAALESRGVHTAIHYPVPIHLQDAFEGLGQGKGSLPHTEHACDRVLSMPLFPEMTREQAEYAAATLRAVADGGAR
jgi:dTDP-4-amino-4,6-dideoxygalactose transaminase